MILLNDFNLKSHDFESISIQELFDSRINLKH